MILVPLAITQIENEDDRAFMENVYLKYQRLFYWVALDYVSYSDADDVINTACEKMCKKIYEMKGMPSNGLRGYVVSIVRNTALDHIAKNARQNANRDYSSDDTLENKVTYNENLEDLVLRRSLISDVREAMGRLHGREKEVMLLKFYDNLPAKEIAERLRITENNVRGVLMRARAHIVQDLIDRKRIDADEVYQ